MPKANLLLLNPPDRAPVRKEIVTDWHPAGKYVFFLTRLSTMRLVTAQSRGEDLFLALDSGKETIPPVGDEPIVVSRSTCIFAVSLDLAQCGPEEESYTAKEILRMMAEDKVLVQMTDIRETIMPLEPDMDEGGEESDPLAKSPPSPEKSTSPSSPSESDTPASSNGHKSSSGRSTNGLAAKKA